MYPLQTYILKWFKNDSRNTLSISHQNATLPEPGLIPDTGIVSYVPGSS
jgi:hypothetical protein